MEIALDLEGVNKYHKPSFTSINLLFPGQLVNKNLRSCLIYESEKTLRISV